MSGSISQSTAAQLRTLQKHLDSLLSSCGGQVAKKVKPPMLTLPTPLEKESPDNYWQRLEDCNMGSSKRAKGKRGGRIDDENPIAQSASAIKARTDRHHHLRRIRSTLQEIFHDADLSASSIEPLLNLQDALGFVDDLGTGGDKGMVAAAGAAMLTDAQVHKSAGGFTTLTSAKELVDRLLTRAVTNTSPLSDHKETILRNLLELRAFDADTRKKTASIATHGGRYNASVESLKTPMTELRRDGLVDTRIGSGGGVWLTKAGKARAQRLSPNR